jgi:hypothetical protein
VNVWSEEHNIGWFWTILPFCGLAVILLACGLTKNRWGLLGTILAVCCCLLGYTWARDWAYSERLAWKLVLWVEPSTHGVRQFIFRAGHGGIELTYIQSFISVPPMLIDRTRKDPSGPWLDWDRDTAELGRPISSLYPQQKGSRNVNFWGLYLSGTNTAETKECSLTTPIWLFTLFLAAASFLAWRRQFKLSRIRRWVREGRCVCGYDLQGHREVARSEADTGAKCPECGRAIPPHPGERSRHRVPKLVESSP